MNIEPILHKKRFRNLTTDELIGTHINRPLQFRLWGLIELIFQAKIKHLVLLRILTDHLCNLPQLQTLEMIGIFMQSY